jgi:thymidine phosphorylase
VEEGAENKILLQCRSKAMGISKCSLLMDQPISRGIGPSLEAMDVLSVCKRKRRASRFK